MSWTAGSLNETYPAVPYPGVRGEPGLVNYVTIKNSNFTLSSHTLTIIKAPREGFNTGGDQFANAPLITAGEPQYGSLSNFETGQFYKVTLAGNQTVYVSGYLTRSLSPSTAVMVKLYDTNYAEKKVLLNTTVGSETKVFPIGSPAYYTNPNGVPTDYYLKIYSANYILHEFQLVAEVPRLTVTPNPVTRGSQATFTVSGIAGATLSNWTCDSTSYGTVNRTVNTTATTWSGVIVAEGIGNVTVSRGGSSSVILAPTLQVTARTGWAFTAKQPSKETWTFTTPDGKVLDPPNPPGISAGPFGGESGLDLMFSGGADTAINDDGPNQQFKYFSSPIADSAQGKPTGYYWVLSPDLENTSSEFFLKQCGDYNPMTQTGVYISGANLLAQTIRHESGASQSHHANYVSAQNASATNLGMIAERAVAGASTSQPAFIAGATADLNAAGALIVSAMLVEPYPVNHDENDVFLGNPNLPTNYANCP